jgi:hypothetical protein
VSRLLPLVVLALALIPAAPAFGAQWSAPQGVTATTTSDGKVDLAWQPVPGAVGYQVYRTRSAGAMDEAVGAFATPAASTSSPRFTDASVSDGKRYHYAVKAVGVGMSPASETTAVTARVADCNGTNPIEVENCLPGNVNWKTVDGAPPSLGGIEGFATATSVEAGQSVDLKVNTQSGAPYQVEVYRSGWYAGTQGRLVSTLPARLGVQQPACDVPPGNTGLKDCANWSTTDTLTTTADWTSGVYLLRLRRTDTESASHVLLTVRQDRACSDLTYVTPVTTYQAYNNWGGKSAYTFNSSGAVTDAGTTRAVKLSFNRPYTQDPPERNWYTEADLPNVSWLERQGYNLNYVTSVDLHAGIPFMTYRKALISASHDEYWSAEMRQAATAARDSGMGLFFLGSNASYWKLGFENDNRHLAIYKSTEGPSGADSTPTTSTWRDPAKANQPENALVGQQYIGASEGSSGTSLGISYAQAQHPIWRHTILDGLPEGAFPEQINGIVGWEWDARANNDHEPDGVQTFAASAVSGQIVQDPAGVVYAPGSSTQNSTTYELPNGALVVATGTNYWSRGLGTNVLGAGAPHKVVFQATVNALRDMDAAPSTPTTGDELGVVVDPGASPPNCPPPPPVDPQPTPTPDPGTPPGPGPGPGGGGTPPVGGSQPGSGSQPGGGGQPGGNPPPSGELKTAQLKITSIRAIRGRLVVKGTIVRTAKGKVRVTVARRKAQAAIGNGRWTARLRIARNVRRVTVKASFPGSSGIKRAVATRKKRL